MNKVHRLKNVTPYEIDFARWSEEQAALLRSGRFDAVDLENVAEEIESLGRSDKREISNRVGVILLHLLKWEFQPPERKPGWLLTLDEQRDSVRKLIKESPSLKRVPGASINQEFEFARRKAAVETGLDLASFPTECPYAAEDLLDLDFLPGPEWPRLSDFRR